MEQQYGTEIEIRIDEGNPGGGCTRSTWSARARGIWMWTLKEEKAKLDEFRANNIALRKQLEELKKRFEGIDPDEVRKLAEEKRQLEEAQQLKAGEVEKVVETRLKAARGRAGEAGGRADHGARCAQRAG